MLGLWRNGRTIFFSTERQDEASSQTAKNNSGAKMDCLNRLVLTSILALPCAIIFMCFMGWSLGGNPLWWTGQGVAFYVSALTLSCAAPIHLFLWY